MLLQENGAYVETALCKMRKRDGESLSCLTKDHNDAIMMLRRVWRIVLCAGSAWEKWREFIMVRQVKVSNFAEVQGIVSAAAKCYNEVGVHDVKGSIADAKSILGLMSLDFSQPVKIVCEDENDLNRVVKAIEQ